MSSFCRSWGVVALQIIGTSSLCKSWGYRLFAGHGDIVTLQVMGTSFVGFMRFERKYIESNERYKYADDDSIQYV